MNNLIVMTSPDSFTSASLHPMSPFGISLPNTTEPPNQNSAANLEQLNKSTSALTCQVNEVAEAETMVQMNYLPDPNLNHQLSVDFMPLRHFRLVHSQLLQIREEVKTMVNGLQGSPERDRLIAYQTSLENWFGRCQDLANEMDALERAGIAIHSLEPDYIDFIIQVSSLQDNLDIHWLAVA